MSDKLRVTGKVIVLKDSERVIDKWSLRLLYAVALANAFAGVLRLIAWVMER